MGEFSLQAQQGDVRAVFLPLSLLQRDLEVRFKFNALLISGRVDRGAVESLVRKHFQLEDVGLELRESKPGLVILESESRLIEDLTASTSLTLASEMGLKNEPL